MEEKLFGPKLLTTKLYPPPTRPSFVPRSHLIERLQDSPHRKLTLISAPAGFGKTTLVSEWLHQTKLPTAWLSLDESDNDIRRFLSYLIAALQTKIADVGEDLLHLLQSPSSPPTISILTGLLNALSSQKERFALVLDDYHILESPPIDEALAFLLEHLPPQLHLIIATREDPPFPLSRLRVRGQLLELRAIDLRFTPKETSAFLNDMMGLKLSEKDISALESRTEGWIAGLQLAALSMQGREDFADFIHAFTGEHRYIVDYLVEEVLLHQPETTRLFLLQTSILQRLCGSLCDAVTQQTNCHTQLEALEQGNLFVVPLDQKRLWFRYHHLFADVLHAHAMKEFPEQVLVWHQRASHWCEQHRLEEQAIHHALAAKAFERVAHLLESVWPSMDGRFQTKTWLVWAKRLPKELFSSRPVLTANYAWALLNDGQLEEGDKVLQELEERLQLQQNKPFLPKEKRKDFVVSDEEQFLYLEGSIYTARAYLTQAFGDLPTSVRYAQRALQSLPKEDHLRRGPAAALVGLTHWANGDLEIAHQELTEAMDAFRKAGNLHFAISGTYGMADIRLVQGRLQDVFQHYEQSLQLATAQSDAMVRGIADLYLGFGELHREMGALEKAQEWLQKSEELGEFAALPDWKTRFFLARARLLTSLGQFEEALQHLDKAEKHYIRGPVPNLRPIEAWRVRIWLKQRHLQEALRWSQTLQVPQTSPLDFLHEFEYITLARTWLAQDETTALSNAMHLLDRLLASAEQGQRQGSALEILLLLALTHHRCGKTSSAIELLARSLKLAEPQGYLQIFIDEGETFSALLELLDENIYPQKKSLQQKLSHRVGSPLTSPLEVSSITQDKAASSLIEPLSPREIEILTLIAQGLSNRDISKRLFLSLSTVKGHNQNIFGKLHARRRTEAVARARELGFIAT